jgi:hypothetical protein
MIDLGSTHQSVLECNSRAIVHMRRQILTKRFGLVFGAGQSKDLGIPTWDTLVDRISKDPEIQGEDVLKVFRPREGLPYKTQMLFEHFKAQSYKQAPQDQHHTRSLDYAIALAWRKIVHKHLYADVTKPVKDLLNAHPYLNQYIPLIQKSHMTVTYNFDDIIEQCLLLSRTSGTETQSLGFETVTNPWTQFRRQTAIIYHPNGVIPKNMLEAPSDRFVFSEASYAEQLMGIFAGDQTGLLNHLSKNTCLFIGLSLEDETLRNVLMQNARSCPGNFHYYVNYLKPGETLDPEQMSAVSLTNFKVYNLVTLFLTNEGISALGELIDTDTCPSDQFCDFGRQHDIPVRFRFYITGPLGVGKSTNINQFRNLVAIDEWLDPRPPVLAKDADKLTADEKREADSWIIDQFNKKNALLRNDRMGVFVLDRGPLDPISFTPDAEWNSKATSLIEGLCPGKADWRVEDGKVILLQGDHTELALRMIVQEKDYTSDKLQKMESKLIKAYGKNGVILFDTKGLTISDVTKRIAEIIHIEPYRPTCDLHTRLEMIKKEGINVSE